MENQNENLIFFIRCREVINSSFVMFETKLEDMLYGLAECPIIYSIVEKCLKDYNYSFHKQNCLVSPTVNSRGYFNPPQDRRDFIAFSFNVLYELFEKKVAFTDLVDLYFDGATFKEKFDNFKQRLIVNLYKFLLSVVEELTLMYNEKTTKDNDKIEEKKDKITLLKDCILEEKIKQEDKEYLFYFIDSVIQGKSPEVCFTAIKYILSNYKKGEVINQQILEALNL